MKNTSLIPTAATFLFTILAALLSLFIAAHSDVVHQPLLFMVLANVAIGYVAPRWTWACVPLFCLTMAGGYFYAESQTAPLPELTGFCTTIAAFPSLFGVATGWLLKRIMQMPSRK